MQNVILLVVLFVSIPFVQASTLQVQLSGKDRVNGYAKSNDELVLDVFAAIEGDASITPEQVRINVEGATLFPSACKPKEGGSQCSYSEPIVNRKGAVSYSVSLADDSGAVVADAGQTLIIDDEKPVIVSFQTAPERIVLGAFTIEYSVQDGTSTACSGIKSAKVYIKETKETVAEKTFEPENCGVQDVLAYEYKGKSGEFNLCLSAKDWLGQETEACRQLVADTEPPVFVSAGLYSNMTPTQFVGQDGGTLSVGVTLNDAAGIKPENVLVNLEKLTGNAGDVRSATRVLKNVFLVDNVMVSPAFMCTGRVTATDEAGNTLQKDFECKLAIDKEGPEPLTITTNLKGPDGELLLNQNGTITVTISENAVLLPEKVFMNLYTITGESKAKADRCWQDGVWKCSWGPLEVKGKGGQTVELLEESTDTFGNRFTKSLKEEVDITDLVVGITELQHSPRFVSSADDLTFSFFVVPLGIQPKVDVNVSSISRAAGMKTAKCEESIGKWQCGLTVVNLKPTNDSVPVQFFLSDDSGNKYTTTYPVDIFEADPEKKDFFRISAIKIQPSSGIDRKTAGIVPYPITLQPFLQSTDPGANVASFSITCDEKQLVVPPQVLNPESKQPLILLKFDPAVAEENATELVKMPCVAKILAKKERTVFTTPEVENFTARIPLYNNPLGTIDETTQKKIESVNLQIKNIKDKISEWAGVNKVLGKIGGIGQTIAQVDAAMSIATIALWVVAMVLKAIIPAAGIAVWTPTCYVNDVLNVYIIKLVVWPPAYVGNPLIKMASIVNSCQMCRHTGEYTVKIDKLTGALVTDVDKAEGVQTTINAFSQYLWEPHKSIHVASLCFCPAGIEYNLRKQKQLYCIYRNCIRENSQKGLPLTGCEQTLKEQNCLYVDSAGWKVAGGGGVARLFARMALLAIEKIPEVLAGVLWQALCHPLLGVFQTSFNALAIGGCANGPDTMDSVKLVLCAGISAPSMLLETEFFSDNRFNWDQYTGDLEGADYCGE